MRYSSFSTVLPLAGLALAIAVAGCGCSASNEQQTTDPAQALPRAVPSPGCLAKVTRRPDAPFVAAARSVKAGRSAGAPLVLTARSAAGKVSKDKRTDKADRVDGTIETARVAGLVDVTFRVTVPANTPAGADIYLAGDLQGWNPGDSKYRFARQSAGLYSLTLSLEDGSVIQFKLTRGSWDTVEKGSQGEELNNRTFQVAGSEAVDLVVASWADTAPAPPRTLVGDIDEMTVPSFLDGRRVWVYLPPGYATEVDRCYSVLYMFDGQNLFDSSTAFLGNEWNVDQSLEDSIAAGTMQPIIVVAIDNGGGARLDEYTPWPDPEYGGGQADAHFQAIEQTLIPYINRHFRTYIDPAHTGIAGSSLGGLMSLYAAYAHGDTFGSIGALSPSLWWDSQHLLAFVQMTGKKSARTIYMDMGTIESGQVIDENGNGLDDNIDYLRAVRETMVGQGYQPGKDLQVIEDEGARHNETAWSRRFPGTLQFLFPAN